MTSGLFTKARQNRYWVPCLVLILITGLWLTTRAAPMPAAAAVLERGVAGHVTDSHGEPVNEAKLQLFVNDSDQPVSETHSQPDGAYLLVLPQNTQATAVRMTVQRAHFQPYEWNPGEAEIATLVADGSFVTHNVSLARRVTTGFWVAIVVFVGMLALIASEKLHNTLAALLAVAIILSVSLAGSSFNSDLFIFTFEQALGYVDFEVIFLLLGMMIIIGVIEETGIFQWLAYQAYRLSAGKVWLLAVILMSVTAGSSALLDNVTTMLLITPITLEIALALGVNPLTLILPALMAANVGGTTTLIGTPVNIMIGSFTGLGFNDFLINLTPGVLLGLAGLMVYVLYWYRREYRKVKRKPSRALLARLEENGRIRDEPKLRKAAVVFAVLLALFVFGEPIHLSPAVAAIIGAVVMLVWVHPDIEQMMGVVDWTTLIFFISLFIVIGAVQEVGLLALAADGAAALVAGNSLAALLVVIWIGAIISGIVDNIPFAAAMLPVVGYLTRTVPGAQSNVLFFALAIGANLGGNSSLIGSSANLVVAGIAERAGYRITFRSFLKVGIPTTLITTAIGTIWLLIWLR